MYYQTRVKCIALNSGFNKLWWAVEYKKKKWKLVWALVQHVISKISRLRQVSWIFFDQSRARNINRPFRQIQFLRRNISSLSVSPFLSPNVSYDRENSSRHMAYSKSTSVLSVRQILHGIWWTAEILPVIDDPPRGNCCNWEIMREQSKLNRKRTDRV